MKNKNDNRLSRITYLHFLSEMWARKEKTRSRVKVRSPAKQGLYTETFEVPKINNCENIDYQQNWLQHKISWVRNHWDENTLTARRKHGATAARRFRNRECSPILILHYD
jgi:hypothetical protein